MKSPMDKERLQYFRRRLMQEKHDLEKREHNDHYGFAASQLEYTNELSMYDNHPGDIGTETFERGKDLALLRADVLRMERVQDALERIGTGEYGHCAECGKFIPMERLEALPTAIYCIEHEPRQGVSNERPAEEAVRNPPYGRTSRDDSLMSGQVSTEKTRGRLSPHTEPQTALPSSTTVRSRTMTKSMPRTTKTKASSSRSRASSPPTSPAATRSSSATKRTGTISTAAKASISSSPTTPWPNGPTAPATGRTLPADHLRRLGVAALMSTIPLHQEGASTSLTLTLLMSSIPFHQDRRNHHCFTALRPLSCCVRRALFSTLMPNYPVASGARTTYV
ncbi:TraR/DksA C4-type zinc finger protein [Cohnella kolymensis]|uniref:TraR/DksA C4-type zinc finger protein n=1 Tax=Cohnella kolymensis TaxID=1590652 RepID=UPI000AE43633